MNSSNNSNNNSNNNNNNPKQLITNQTINTTEKYKKPSFQITTSQVNEFQENGFITFPNVFDQMSVSTLNARLEFVLRGQYNTGVKPDKTPKLIKVPLPQGVVMNDDEEGNDGVDGNNCGDCRLLGYGDDVGNGKADENRVETETTHASTTPKIATCEVRNGAGIQTHQKEDKFIPHEMNSSSQHQQQQRFPPPSVITTKKKKKKTPKSIGPLGYSGNKQNNKVMQIINVHKCDSYFHQLVTTDILGYMVSTLMKWDDGARLAQDQIWAKPPGSPPLAYHRDSPYFMFEPHSVATVWIALDDMYGEEIGPLTYVKKSHLWNDGRVGSSQNFFQSNGGMALLHSAAERSGLVQNKDELEFVSMEGMQAGGLSIHDGRTWHGSGGNKSDRPRRGIGLHFVPVNVKWTRSAMNSRLWRRYVEDVVEDDGDVEAIELDQCDFPVVYRNEE